MEEFSQDLSVALEEANQQDSDSCTEQVMQKPRRPRRRRPRKDVPLTSPVSRSEGVSPERPRRSKRPPRMQLEGPSVSNVQDCQMLSVSSSSSDLPSECGGGGGCCGCSSEADDEQTDFPHNEPPPPKIKAIHVELAPPLTHPGSALTNEFRRRVHSAGTGNRGGPGCSEQGRKRRRRCCPLVNPVIGSPSVSDSSPAGIKLHKGCVGFSMK